MRDETPVGDRIARHIAGQVLQDVFRPGIVCRWRFDEHDPAVGRQRVQPVVKRGRVLQFGPLAIQLQFALGVQPLAGSDERFSKTLAQ